MSIMIDTPDGIAFARAAARNAALKMELQGLGRRGQSAYSIAKDVYGLTGNRRAVSEQLDEYVQGTLAIRGWDQARFEKAGSIIDEAQHVLLQRLTPEQFTKDAIDAEVQRMFASGAITEDEGNDACLLLFVTVVKQWAGQR